MNNLNESAVQKKLDDLEMLIVETIYGETSHLDEIETFNSQIESDINRFEISKPMEFLRLKINHLKIKVLVEKACHNHTIIPNLENLISEYESKLLNSEFQVLSLNTNTENNSTINRHYESETITFDAAVSEIISLLKSDFTEEFIIELTNHIQMIIQNLKFNNSYDNFSFLITSNQLLIEKITNLLSEQEINENIANLIDYLNLINKKIEENFMINMINSYNECLNNTNLEKNLKLNKPSIALYNELSLKDSKFLRNRFRNLSRQFHPDKNKIQFCSEFFDIIRKCHDYLLEQIYSNKMNSLNEKNKMQVYEAKANEYCNLAADYNRLANGKSSMYVIKAPPNLTATEFKNQAKYFAELSFQEYMNACKIADELELKEKQLGFRNKMALCYYIADKLLETQLILISNLFLIKKFQNDGAKQIREDLINELKAIMKKIEKKCSGKTSVSNESNLNGHIKSTNNDVKDLVNVGDNSKEILDENFKNSAMLLLEKDRYNTEIALTNIDSNLETINKSIMNTKVVGGLAALSSTGLTAIQAIEAVSIFKAYWTGTATAGLIFGPAVMCVAGLVTLIGSVAGTYYISKNRYESYKKENNKRKACNTLNEIFKTAIECYNIEDFENFIEAFTTKFDGKQLIEYRENYIRIDPKEIANIMLYYEFPPDGIAYLLNLIATVLFSGKLKPKGNYGQFDLQIKAKDLLNYVSDDSNLIQVCKNLDVEFKNKKTRFFQNKTNLESFMENNRNLKSLTEAQLTAKINLILLTIATHGFKEDGQEQLEKQLESLKTFIRKKNFFFNSGVDSYLQLMEFIFVVFNIKLPIIYSDDIKFSEENEEINIEMDDELKALVGYLSSSLKNEKDIQRKLHFYLLRAEIFFNFAKKKSKNKFNEEKFFFFKKSKDDFEQMFYLDKKRNKDNVYMYLECLINLKLFKDANSFIESLYDRSTFDAELDFYHGIVMRNLNDFDLALFYFKKAEEKFCTEKNKEKENSYRKEIEILNSLINEEKYKYRAEKYIEDFKRFKSNDFTKKQSNVFKIISIDGGGVRGIIPAILLREIQRRCNKPLVTLVDLFAGTSTGAILCAGLNVSENPIGSIPKYSPDDMVKFYIDESPKIFKKSILRYYKQDNLKNILSKKVNFSFTNLINHVLIPTSTDIKTLYTFTKHDSSMTSNKNYSLVDILTAATAAPTYFPAYQIEGILHKLMDGGILANNPSRLAYEHAVNVLKIPSENIHIISIGTGDYISHLFNENESNSILFWAQNISDYIIDGHKNQVNLEMNQLIGDRFKRLQIYLNEPICLDDYSKIPDLITITEHFIEENTEIINEIAQILQN
ncbi:unnamed protein product [Brachionus calyciflorus]|uniref:PNPLA domain-containing protein n=1 Tax=Brachionus calyciflorus TaxID=104777 RepID=A0A814GRW2_9BILA|nr:unnamed protein product [Brachionus calyciflorus]